MCAESFAVCCVVNAISVIQGGLLIMVDSGYASRDQEARQVRLTQMPKLLTHRSTGSLLVIARQLVIRLKKYGYVAVARTLKKLGYRLPALARDRFLLF